ncbi:MAG: hypothetical protein AAGA40_17350 [Cyanobacteria bacterium P01_E01_bin.45]
MPDLRDTLSSSIRSQGKLFSYLLAPESYLLAAGLLSGMVSALLITLNGIAIHCALTSCSALMDDSNNVQSWLLFEGLTVFFITFCIIPLMKYRTIRKQRY